MEQLLLRIIAEKKKPHVGTLVSQVITSDIKVAQEGENRVLAAQGTVNGCSDTATQKIR